jgi:hypothetical protein
LTVEGHVPAELKEGTHKIVYACPEDSGGVRWKITAYRKLVVKVSKSKISQLADAGTGKHQLRVTFHRSVKQSVGVEGEVEAFLSWTFIAVLFAVAAISVAAASMLIYGDAHCGDGQCGSLLERLHLLVGLHSAKQRDWMTEMSEDNDEYAGGAEAEAEQQRMLYAQVDPPEDEHGSGRGYGLDSGGGGGGGRRESLRRRNSDQVGIF